MARTPPPAGNVVPIAFARLRAPIAGNVVPIAFVDPIPPDPEPEVPLRWVGRAASLPWARAAQRPRIVRSGYARSARRQAHAHMLWTSAPPVRAGVTAAWGDLPTLTAAMWARWSHAAALPSAAVSVPWARLPVALAATSLPWGTRPCKPAAAAIAWTAPPRIDVSASLPWGLPPRLAVSAEILWTAPPVVARKWWLPWGYAQRVRWIVRSPDVDPPEPEIPWHHIPPRGDRVPIAFACRRPTTPIPGNAVPIRFGRAACYFAWPRPRRYIVLNSAAVVRLPERTPIPVSSVSISASIDDAFRSITMTLADPAALGYLLPSSEGKRSVEINLNGHVWTAIIESHARHRRFPATAVTVTGRSRTAVLDANPRSVISGTDEQAQSLAEAALDLTGITLDWDTLTWLVPAGAWAYDSLPPIAAVTKAAEGAGAVVQSHPWDLSLRVAPRYPVSPWHWGTAAPDKQILDDMILEDALRVVSLPVYDYVLVSGEHVGVSDPIIRDGSAGETRANMITDPLITTHDVAAERGRNVLSDRGEQALIDLTIPLYPPSASDMPGLLHPLQLCEVVEAVAWKGLVVGVQIDAAMQQSGSGAATLVIDQRVTLERHYTDAG